MDLLSTRGQVVLDDSQVRLRTSSALARFTELFALKADQSTVDNLPTTTQVQALIDAAIAALKGGAPALLDTLDEIAAAINDDADVYNTLLTLIGQKQTALTLPSTQQGTNLLANGVLRDIEVSGLATMTHDGSTVFIAVNGMTNATFQTHRTEMIAALLTKQPNLSSGGGTGQEILTGTTIRRLRVTGPGSLTADANEVLLALTGYTQAEVNTLLAGKETKRPVERKKCRRIYAE